MKLLLDTHTVIWSITEDSLLSSIAKSAIADPGNELYISMASEWEIAIKFSIRKLDLKYGLESFLNRIDEFRPQTISIGRAHLIEYEKLPLHHRDPFDRLMIAQARAENLTIVSKDEVFKKYDVKVLW